MRALTRKLIREAGRQRGQMLSIAAVVAVGIMTVLAMRGTYESLAKAQEVYYREARFPHVWARLKRAPESLGKRIGDIPGVAVADSRVSTSATLDVPAIETPATGQFVSVPDTHRPALSDLHVISGRYLAPGARNEVLVSKNFALANQFVPGDTLKAVLNGRFWNLVIVGTAISPEFTYAIPPGSLYPDNERFGIVWMSRSALAAAYDLEGAFNEVVLTYAPGADGGRVRAELDALLAPYGGLGSFERADQTSHAILQSELDSNRSMGIVIPVIFLMVAAFLLNMVLTRMITTQRTEIGVLKAFGYTDGEVGTHYLLFAMVAVAMGAMVGLLLGLWAGSAMTTLYGDFFDFPDLRYRFNWRLLLLAAGISAAAAGVGALGAARRAIRLPPADAMRPEPPATFRSGILERSGLRAILPPAGRMILRNVERTPLRSLFSSIGVAFSVAILVVGMFMFDGVTYMMDLQFRLAQREDLTVTFAGPKPLTVRDDLLHLNGVTQAETYRFVPVRLHRGHRKKEAGITGLSQDTRLRRIVTASGSEHPLPSEGLVMSRFLADRLGARPGDVVEVEVLEGERRRARVAVAGVLDDFVGVSAYMDLDAMHRLARGPRTVSGAFLKVDDADRPALNARLKDLPAIAGVASPAELLQSFETQLEDSLFISVFFLLLFSGIISVAVVYNGARIALSERGRELASLRVLGFSRAEVTVLLLGEQALTTLAGIPVGWWLGYLLAMAVSVGLRSEIYRIPLIIDQDTFLLAALITVAAAILSGLIVRARLDRMNLIEVLKTRE